MTSKSYQVPMTVKGVQETMKAKTWMIDIFSVFMTFQQQKIEIVEKTCAPFDWVFDYTYFLV